MTAGTERVVRVAVVNSDGKHALPLPDPPGIVTTLHDLRLRVLARTPYAHLLTELGTLEAAERAMDEGCEAIYIDTVGDYALDRVRAISPVPVIGAGEEGIRAAAALGPFSVVTVWPRSMAFLYEERLRTVSGGDRCRGVHHYSTEDELERVGRANGVKARMLRREDDLVTGLIELCRHAVHEDGSASILLGCTCMSPVTGRIASALEMPVLDPSAIGLDVAHRLALASPFRASSQAGEHLATALVDAYLSAVGSTTLAPDDCDACSIIPHTPEGNA